jgi:hypothetical protein
MAIFDILIGLILLILAIAGPVPLSFCLTDVLNEKKRKEFSHNLFVVFFFWCVLQISIGLLAGLLHLFNGPGIFTAEILLFITGLTALKINKLNMKEFLNFPKDLALFEKILLLLAALLAVTLLWKFLAYPMGDSDTLAFHLPAMAEWYQRQFIFFPVQIPYPYNWEILCALFFFPFGRDFAAALPNLFSWLALGLVILRICRELGVLRKYAMAAALLVLCIPECLNMINTMHIDLAFALFFAAGLYFLLLFYKTGAFNNALMLILSIAMMMGIKASGIPYGALLIFCLFMALIFKPNAGKTAKPSAFLLLMTLFLLPLIGGFWYIKNWIETGNPLAFVNVSVFGAQLFAGKTSVSDLSNWTLAHNFQIFNSGHWKILMFAIIKRLQFPFIILIISSLFSLKILFVKDFERKKITVMMVLLALAAALMYCVTPFTADNPISPWIGAAFRYGFPFMIIIGILSALAFQEWKTKNAILLTFLITSVFLGMMNTAVIDTVKYDRSILLNIEKSVFFTALKSNPKIIFDLIINILKTIVPYLILTIIAAAAWFILFFKKTLAENLNKKKLLSYSIGSVLLLMTCAILLSISTTARSINIKSNYGEVIDYINKNIGAQERIGFAFCDIYYPLYGSRLENRVSRIQLNMNDINSCLSSMKQAKINYLSIGPIQGSISNVNMIRNSPFIKWLENKSEFKRVSGGRFDSMALPEKPFIVETDYFYRSDRGRVLYRLNSF